MNLRSYQNLESGATKLDLERLSQIAEVLETTTEDLLRQDGVFIHQEIRETSNGFVYHYGIEEAMLNKLLAAGMSATEGGTFLSSLGFITETYNQRQ